MQACISSLCLTVDARCPVAQAPATTMGDCNLELWDEPFLPIVSFVREFYHSNRTVNTIVSFLITTKSDGRGFQQITR